MPDVRSGRITSWQQLSPVLATFRLAPEDGHRFPTYEAGQHIALRRERCRLTRRVKEPDGETGILPELDEWGRQRRGPVTHAYSIASAPFRAEEENRLEFFVVLAIAGGLGRLTESLFDSEPREGSALGYVERVAGDFTLSCRLKGASTVVMVATGTGLAPFASMVRQLDHDAAAGRPVPAKVTLFFGNRTEAEMAFHDELTAIAGRRHLDFAYVPTISRPIDGTGNEAIGRGRASNLLRRVLGLPTREEEALLEARERGGDTTALESALERAVRPRLPANLDPATLRARMDPATTVMLACGSRAGMEDVRRVAERQGIRVEREQW